MLTILKKEFADLLRVFIQVIVIGMIVLLWAALPADAQYSKNLREPFEILEAEGLCIFGKDRGVDMQKQIDGCDMAVKYYSYPETDRAAEIGRMWRLSEAYYRRGVAYHRHLDFDRALKDFTAAIDLNTGNVDALNSRAYVRLNRGEYPEAKADIDASLKLTRIRAETFWLLGQYFEEIGDNARAIEAYESALQRDLNHSLALKRLRVLENGGAK